MANYHPPIPVLKTRTTREDTQLIRLIANRAMLRLRCDMARITIIHAITTAHLNGSPLRLADLLTADDFNFYHDVVGIHNHLDRTTGRLGGGFSPRFSKRSDPACAIPQTPSSGTPSTPPALPAT